MTMRRWLVALCTAVLLATCLVAIPAPPSVQAAPVGGFNPENIISDANFFDANAMDEGQIQAFLRGLPCSPRDGVPCLGYYTQNTQSRPDAGANQCGPYQGANAEPSARIIAKVAQACGISPRVLLVLMQKEQSLLTNPSAWGYAHATGANCPDTPQGCDPAYAGFFTQVYSAAWQFRNYAKYPNSFNYRIGNSFVLYNPNRACGGSTLNLRNQATVNLYIYTPYQPNAASLNNLYGSGDSCSTYGNRNFWRMYWDWFGSPTDASPIGSLDGVSSLPGGAQISGWALDFDTRDSLNIHVYVDGAFAAGFPANISRGDVAARYRVGDRYGFSQTVSLSPGAHQVCVYALNVGSGSNTPLGCRTVQPGTGSPFGNVEGTSPQPGGFRVSGWAIDPDTADPIFVHTYTDGSFSGGFLASAGRSDVGAAYPGYGSAHGFGATIAASSGIHRVCVYGLNVGSGVNTLLGCTSVVVGGNPVGTIDGVSSGLQRIDASGWALDPDVTDPVWIHAYLDGRFATSAYASTPRADLAASAFGSFGANHGYSLSVPASNGTHTLCLYALNVGSGSSNTSLGCRTVLVGGDPIGRLDAAQPGFASVTASGWIYDPDTTDPVSFHVYVDGTFATGGLANAAAPNAGIAAEYGTAHGFSTTVPVSPGTHEVCVYGLNTGVGTSNPQIGCSTVTVSGDPVGAIEDIQTVGQGYGVYGYAVDPDTTAPIWVHVYVDGVFAGGYQAGYARPDLAARFPGFGPSHAYSAMVPASAGTHRICVYAINEPGATNNPLLGCMDVVRR